MDRTSSQLRSLVELTRRGTITAVAEALGYTPGGVSQQIAALERSRGEVSGVLVVGLFATAAAIPRCG